MSRFRLFPQLLCRIGSLTPLPSPSPIVGEGWCVLLLRVCATLQHFPEGLYKHILSLLHSTTGWRDGGGALIFCTVFFHIPIYPRGFFVYNRSRNPIRILNDLV